MLSLGSSVSECWIFMKGNKRDQEVWINRVKKRHVFCLMLTILDRLFMAKIMYKRALNKELWIIGWVGHKKIHSLLNSEGETDKGFSVFPVNMRLISSASFFIFPFLWCFFCFDYAVCLEQ